MPTVPVIAISGLTKRYAGSERLALDNLSITVNAGEVYGFLGPNGAGKSTTIRLLMDFLRPTAGSAQILGHDTASESVTLKASVGYLFGDYAVYPKMTGRQYLDYLSDLQGGKSLQTALKLARLFKADIDVKMGELSRGNRQKIAIIQAFMHNPKVLILDEPTSGLDPLMQETFYALIRKAKQAGAAIFVSSHVLSEVQVICDRVGIIRDGKLVAENSIAELARDAAQTFEITFATAAPVGALRKLSGVKIQEHQGKRVLLHFQGALTPLLRLLANYDIESLDTRTLDLETMFMHYYTDTETTK